MVGVPGDTDKCTYEKDYDWDDLNGIAGATKKFSAQSLSTLTANNSLYVKGTCMNQTVGFTPSVAIPVGGKIELKMHSNWAFTTNSDVHSPSLADEDTAAGVSVDYTNTQSGREVTISDFAAVAIGTTISIELTDILPSAETVVTKVDFVSELNTYNADNELLNVWDTSNTDTKITINQDYEETAKGTSSNWTVELTPDNAKVTIGADTHLKFKLSEKLCAGSVLTITSPLGVKLAAGDIKDSCWSNKIYSECRAETNGFKLTFAEEINSDTLIELYIEKASTLPTVTTATTNGFKASASWSNVTNFINDTANTVTFTASAEISGVTITDKKLEQSVKNAGEYSEYTFKFKSSRGYVLKDKFTIEFPAEYDAFVANAKQVFDDSDDYYVNCSSDALKEIWCTVCRHRITIWGETAVDDQTEIDITIEDVMNPKVMSLAAGKFILGQLDENDEYKVLDVAFDATGIATTALPKSDIVMKSVDVSSHELFKSAADYTFTFFLDTKPTAEQNLQVDFPPQFELAVDDGKDDYVCAT